MLKQRHIQYITLMFFSECQYGAKEVQEKALLSEWMFVISEMNPRFQRFDCPVVPWGRNITHEERLQKQRHKIEHCVQHCQDIKRLVVFLKRVCMKYFCLHPSYLLQVIL